METLDVTDLVLGSSGPAMISLKSRLKAFLALMPVLAPMDHTVANRNAPCMGWKHRLHKHSDSQEDHAHIRTCEKARQRRIYMYMLLSSFCISH